MAEQTITKLKLDFSHNVKKSDVETVNELSQSIEKLFETKLDNDVSKNLSTLGNALKTFKGITINQNLGKGILGLVDAANDITNIKDISPYAYKLKESFKVLKDVTEPFKEKSPSINAGLGKGITGLIDAANAITEVKDISPYAENLTKGFVVLSESASSFNDFNAKIPVNLGRGITGLVDAINEIDEVRDISGKAEVIKNSFTSIAQASLMFDGMNTADYTGISRLVTSLSNVGKIKKIDDNVIKNAETLAKAINVLDKEVKADIPKLKEMSNIAKDLGVQYKISSSGVDKFGGSLRSLNIAATVQNIRTLTRTLSTLALQAYGTVESFGEVENTLSFFGQSLGSQAESTAAIIQQYANIGAIDFTQFADQTAKLNQIYRGYGIEAENAAKMALNMTQIAYDASYALGENGKDIQLWFDRAVSVSTGQARSGYYFGVDTSVQALKESFDELSSSTDKANKVTAAYNAIIENTREIQGQMPREFQNTYVQMDVLRNRINLLKQSIGQALIPMFQSLIKWAQIAIAVVERTIDAIVRLFGGKGFKLIDYSSMIQNTADATGGLSDNAVKAADGFGQANKQAKELKKTISGIDQVFTIDDRKPSDSGGGVGAGVGGGAGIAPVEGYDWLETLANAENLANLKSINDTADAIFEKIKNAVPYVAAIAAGFAAWKISKTLLDGLKWISGTKDIFGGLGLDKLTGITGLSLLLGDLNELKNHVADFLENGASFSNVSGILSSFVGSIGSTMVLFGNVKMGGAIKVVQGLIEIASGIKMMVDEGVNWKGAERVLRGMSNVAIGIGLLKGNWVAVGTGLFMQGALGIINEIKENWEAIKKGDWSGVDKATLLIGAIQALGGITTAVMGFKKIADTAKIAEESKEIVETTKSVGEVTKIDKEYKKIKMPSWQSIAKGFAIIAAGIALVVSAMWLIGKIDTSTLKKSKKNTELIGSAFLDLAPALTITLGSAAALGVLINKTPVSWLDIAAGLLAIDVGIVNMIAMISLASLWKTSSLEKGKQNMTIVGDAFKSIEAPLNLLLLKAVAIGTITTASLGLGALALAAGILAINATIVDMLKITSEASKWDTSTLKSGGENIEIAGNAFTTINEPLRILLDMVDKIGKNLTGFKWITGQSYDFDKALGQLKETMDYLLKWIGDYATWDTSRLERGGAAIELAGKSGTTVNEVLAPMLEMLDGIGKKTNNIFGIGDYDYDKALNILKDVMNSLLKWIGDYATWDTSRLERGGIAIDLAGKSGKTINEVLVPLMDMLNGIGGQTYGMNNAGNYDYDGSFSILKGIMDSMIKWIGKYATWDIAALEAGAEVVRISSTPMRSINEAFEELLPLLDSVGKKTNNIFGIGDYDYEKSMGIVTSSVKSIVNTVSDLGNSTNTSKVDKGVEVINKTKNIIKDLDKFNVSTTGDLKKAAKNFGDFAFELKDGFADLDKTKTSNVSKIMEALKSIDLNKFKGIGKQIVESMELGMTSYNFNLKQVETKVKTGLTFSVKNLGTDKAKDVNDGINNYSVNLSTFTAKLKNALTFSTKSYGTTIGKDVVSGVNSSSVSLSTFTSRIKSALTFSAKSYGTTIGGDVVSGINSRSVSIGTFTNRIKSAINFSSRYLGTNIASGVTSGINGYWPNVTTFTNRLKNAMTNAFDIRSPSRWAKQYVGAYIGEGVTEGVNETKVDFNPFKDSVKHSMYGIMEEVDVSPNISMPTINTKELTGSVSDISKDLNAKVSGQFDYSNDGTEKAIVHLTQETVDKMERLIQAVEDGKTIEIDGDKIGEVSDKYIKGKAVRNNMVFGSR